MGKSHPIIHRDFLLHYFLRVSQYSLPTQFHTDKRKTKCRLGLYQVCSFKNIVEIRSQIVNYTGICYNGFSKILLGLCLKTNLDGSVSNARLSFIINDKTIHVFDAETYYFCSHRM